MTLGGCRYEAVEPIGGWEDLRQRLYPNRRVHACFHPTMPAEPLVILHAALRDGVASTVSEILDENREGVPTHSSPCALLLVKGFVWTSLETGAQPHHW